MVIEKVSFCHLRKFLVLQFEVFLDMSFYEKGIIKIIFFRSNRIYNWSFLKKTVGFYNDNGMSGSILKWSV